MSGNERIDTLAVLAAGALAGGAANAKEAAEIAAECYREIVKANKGLTAKLSGPKIV